MPQSRPVHYADAGPDVRAVYDDIKAIRGVDDINNFWKHIANHPPTLQRTWESVKEAMAPGELDPLFKDIDLFSGAKRNIPKDIDRSSFSFISTILCDANDSCGAMVICKSPRSSQPSGISKRIGVPPSGSPKRRSRPYTTSWPNICELEP